MVFGTNCMFDGTGGRGTHGRVPSSSFSSQSTPRSSSDQLTHAELCAASACSGAHHHLAPPHGTDGAHARDPADLPLHAAYPAGANARLMHVGEGADANQVQVDFLLSLEDVSTSSAGSSAGAVHAGCHASAATASVTAMRATSRTAIAGSSHQQDVA